MTPILKQCIHCGFLENGHVKMMPCNRDKHIFEPLSRESLAKALGSTGGRPRTYLTGDDKRAANREAVRKFRGKRK